MAPRIANDHEIRRPIRWFSLHFQDDLKYEEPSSKQSSRIFPIIWVNGFTNTKTIKSIVQKHHRLVTPPLRIPGGLGKLFCANLQMNFWINFRVLIDFWIKIWWVVVEFWSHNHTSSHCSSPFRRLNSLHTQAQLALAILAANTGAASAPPTSGPGFLCCPQKSIYQLP